ncbi:unnamed protein product [Gongylonema pulchrum]|uniref:MICOS complex subunit MIC10 n=1 Tax=Gongylonema pulchrum TaxID=637853 RepID=A0A183D895_9BILA|nr:unnamed protein product [Gongylonema pulchrum]
MVKSEDELGETLDRCLADTALKTLGAGTVGLLAAALFKRQFPLWLGLGMGLGMGIANCRHAMRKPFMRAAPANPDAKAANNNLVMVEEPGRAPEPQSQ